MATMPVDNIIQQTLTKMQDRIEQKAQSGDMSN